MKISSLFSLVKNHLVSVKERGLNLFARKQRTQYSGEPPYTRICLAENVFLFSSESLDGLAIAMSGELRFEESLLDETVRKLQDEVLVLERKSLTAKKFILLGRTVNNPKVNALPYIVREPNRAGYYEWGLVLVPTNIAQQKRVEKYISEGKFWMRFDTLAVPSNSRGIFRRPNHEAAEQHFKNEFPNYYRDIGVIGYGDQPHGRPHLH